MLSSGLIRVVVWHEAGSAHRQKDLVLKACILALGEEVGIRRDRLTDRLNPSRLCLGEIAQYIIMHAVLVARMADAYPHAPIIIADALGDRAQAVMAGIAAAELDPELSGREVQFVVEDDDVRQLDLVITRRLADRAARNRSCKSRA